MNFFLGHFGERNSLEQFWYFNFFILSRFLGRNSSEISLSGWHLSHFQGRTVKKAPCRWIQAFGMWRHICVDDDGDFDKDSAVAPL